MKTTIYKNAVKVKLKNRRISVIDFKDSNDIFIEISLFDKENHKSRAAHQVRRGCIVDTGIKLSEEAAIALLRCLYIKLNSKRSTKEIMRSIQELI